MSFEQELSAALGAVRAAAEVCRSVQGRLVTAETLEKKDKSPVTVADFASQALVCASLAESSKIAAVVGEEDSADLREAGAESNRDKVVEHVRGVRGADVSTDQALEWIDLGGVTPTGECDGEGSGAHQGADGEQPAVAQALAARLLLLRPRQQLDQRPQ